MFLKIFQSAREEERPRIHQLLKFNLNLILRLSEILPLAILLSGLGWIWGEFFIRFIPNFWLGSFAAIITMLLFLLLLRGLALWLKSSLEHVFQLDPRPLKSRLGQIVKKQLKLFFLGAVFSCLFWAALVKLPMHLWILALLAIGLVLLAASHLFLVGRGRARPLSEEEKAALLSPRLQDIVRKLKFDSLWLREDYQTGLRPPYVEGFGKRARLVIPVKNLSAFKPDELEFWLFSALMGQVAKLPLKYFIMRCFSAALVLPFSAILFSLFGPLWGYPLVYSPVLVSIIWAGLWLGLCFSEVADLLIKRQLTAQLEAVGYLILKNEEVIKSALKTLDEKNMTPAENPFWLNLFLPRFPAVQEFKKIQYYAYLSQAPS